MACKHWVVLSIAALLSQTVMAASSRFRIKCYHQEAWVRNLPHPFPSQARVTVYDDPRPPFFVWELVPVKDGTRRLWHIRNAYTGFSAAALEKSGSPVRAVGFEPSRWRVECDHEDDETRCAIFLEDSNLAWTMEGGKGRAVRLQEHQRLLQPTQTWSLVPEEYMVVGLQRVAGPFSSTGDLNLPIRFPLLGAPP